MNSPTITVRFNPSDLPGWAQRSNAVIDRCRVDHTFRCDVYRATTWQYRHHLIRQAERRQEEAANG